MYYVYVLQSEKNHSLYIGYSTNLKQRIADHMAGKNISTSYLLPVKLIFYEAYLSKTDAERREKYFKTTKGKTTLCTMLNDYFATVEVL